MNVGEPRELVLRNRAGKAQPNHMRDFHIAMYIAELGADGNKLEAAVRTVMEGFGVTRATAFRAWKKHRKQATAALQRRLQTSVSKGPPI
jgi:hypothetical protein